MVVSTDQLRSSDQQILQLAFRNYNLPLEDKLIKPAKSARKPSLQTRKRNPGPDILINRLENNGKRSGKKV